MRFGLSIGIVVALAGAEAPAMAGRGDTGVSWGRAGVGFDAYRADAVECARAGAGTSLVGQDAYAGIMLGLSRQDTDIDIARATGGGIDDIARNQALTAQRHQFARGIRTLQDHMVGGVERCLTGKGYVRFALTAPQRRALSRYKRGSDGRFRYLHALAADPAILRTQAIPPARTDP